MKKDSKTRLFEVMSRLDKTFKPKLNEEFEVEKIDTEEPVGEGISYKAKLEEIISLAKKIYKNLSDDELPSWVQDKVVIAKEHLNDIGEFLHAGEEEEETEEEEEGDEQIEIEPEEEIGGEETEEEDETEEETEEEDETEDEEDEMEETKKPKVPVVDIAKTNKK